MTMTKLKIVPVDGKQSDAFSVHSVDAEEYIQTGNYITLDDLLNLERQDQLDKAAPAYNFDEITNMNSKRLVDFLVDNNIHLDGFDALNLKDKREAVINYLQSK